jgi:glycosyltransferase involved in cell wall biosynthesis
MATTCSIFSDTQKAQGENSEILFSVLIPSLERRKIKLERLLNVLHPQMQKEVELIVLTDNGEKTIGTKRNELLQKARGEYIAFVDDDDLVEPYYISEILQALEQKPDVVGLHLKYFENNILKGFAFHSLRYNQWWDEPHPTIKGMRNYYRNPNHLNPVKREYALATKFPEKNFAEDKEYSERILEYLKTEVYVEKNLYHYLYEPGKKSWLSQVQFLKKIVKYLPWKNTFVTNIG